MLARYFFNLSVFLLINKPSLEAKGRGLSLSVDSILYSVKISKLMIRAIISHEVQSLKESLSNMLNQVIRGCLFLSDNARLIMIAVGVMMWLILLLAGLVSISEQLEASRIALYAVVVTSMSLTGWFYPEIMLRAK